MTDAASLWMLISRKLAASRRAIAERAFNGADQDREMARRELGPYRPRCPPASSGSIIGARTR